jgi:hypothetical protein
MGMTDKMRIAGDVIDSTAGEVAADLARRGIDPARPVTVMIEPDDWLTRARAEMRKRVEAVGLSDEDIDRLIKEARRAANKEMRKAGPSRT